MTLIKITPSERTQLESLIYAYDSARSDLEDFLEQIKSSFEESLNDEPEGYEETTEGEEAQDRIATIESWIDEVATPFNPDLSELS